MIDHARTDRNLDEDIYDNTIDYIDKSYRFGVIQSLKKDNRFWRNLSPELKNNLGFALLESHY
jgi:hypothetical protein